jgi:hypothetical protein
VQDDDIYGVLKKHALFSKRRMKLKIVPIFCIEISFRFGPRANLILFMTMFFFVQSHCLPVVALEYAINHSSREQHRFLNQFPFLNKKVTIFYIF